MNLTLGQRVIATRDSGVCSKGERGVVYEEYTIGNHEGVSIIFEKGGYDGFSERDVQLMIEPLEEFCPFGRSYQFRNVGQVSADHRAGRFAFSKEGEALRQDVRRRLLPGGG
jgi:hypothetical protein